jgi:hypothetical protein
LSVSCGIDTDIGSNVYEGAPEIRSKANKWHSIVKELVDGIKLGQFEIACRNEPLTDGIIHWDCKRLFQCASPLCSFAKSSQD